MGRIMPTILILESNTPQIVDRNRARGHATAADNYGRALKANAPDVQIRVAEPYRKALTDADLEGVNGVVFTGSGVAWSTDAPEAADLRQAGERVFNANLPTIGSCNGLQLAAVLLGGGVGPSPKGMEIGLARDVEITEAGRKHPMMQGRKDGFCVPCIHRDEVQRLPQAGVLVASNAHCPVQAMAYHANGVDFWGMQYHPEMPIKIVADSVQDSSGIFGQAAGLSADLRIAETDAAAAARLGGASHDLSEAIRTTELANWIAYLKK
jgi:GMP synthase (glutamine-hydrolysing)